MQERDIVPQCIVRPRSAAEVATAIAVTTTYAPVKATCPYPLLSVVAAIPGFLVPSTPMLVLSSIFDSSIR